MGNKLEGSDIAELKKELTESFSLNFTSKFQTEELK